MEGVRMAKRQIPVLIVVIAFLIASITIGVARNEPTSRPSIDELPSFAPAASENNVASSLPENRSLSKEQVINGKPMSLTIWAYYNGAWCQGPVALNLDDKMSIIAFINRSQNIFGYEKHYLNGREVICYGGYRCGGTYVRTIFTADDPGWHAIAFCGDLSGWSNVIWIYVWSSQSSSSIWSNKSIPNDRQRLSFPLQKNTLGPNVAFSSPVTFALQNKENPNDMSCNCNSKTQVSLDCDDENSCTIDTCTPNGCCIHEPVNCDDGNGCTIDSCTANGCVHEPVNCDDGNGCTIDSCTPNGCIHTPVNCDDGDNCTIDSCTAKGCTHTPCCGRHLGVDAWYGKYWHTEIYKPKWPQPGDP